MSASGTSYVANSFNNAATGSLKLEVNGVVVHTIDLSSGSVGAGNPGSGTDTELNGNSSGFTNLSTFKPGTYSKLNLNIDRAICDYEYVVKNKKYNSYVLMDIGSYIIIYEVYYN